MVIQKTKLNGFSLMELMVVLLIMALLVSIVPPLVDKSISKAEEAALLKNLAVMRQAIDAYYSDNGHYPEALEELVINHYIRSIPKDPVTNSSEEWQLTHNEEQQITDIHSGSNEEARDGTYYRDW